MLPRHDQSQTHNIGTACAPTRDREPYATHVQQIRPSSAAADHFLYVLQALEAITRMSKGLSLGLCTRTCPKIGALLQRPLQLALQCPLVRVNDNFLVLFQCVAQRWL